VTAAMPDPDWLDALTPAELPYTTTFGVAFDAPPTTAADPVCPTCGHAVELHDSFGCVYAVTVSPSESVWCSCSWRYWRPR